MRRFAAVICLLATVSLTACASDDSVSTPQISDDINGPSANVTTTTLNITKPDVTIPDTPPPTTLQIKDITVGTGAEAKAGSNLQMHYVGVSYSTKKEFDSSWKSKRLFKFTLGTGDVIPGWDQGIVGMKVGGRRELTIPPDLGYGARGSGDIKPNETLVFIVDLVAAT